MVLAGFVCFSCQHAAKTNVQTITTELRAPAYPLVTIDPYTSAWSETDQLFDRPIRHWTGKTHSLIGALRVDGQVYRFLGKEDVPLKTLVPMANEEAWDGKYITASTSKGWEQNSFNDSKWLAGKAAFGTPGMQAVTTDWNTKEIWVRREFQLPEVAPGAPIYLIYSHDDDFELYLTKNKMLDTLYQKDVSLILTGEAETGSGGDQLVRNILSDWNGQVATKSPHFSTNIPRVNAFENSLPD